MNQEQKSKQMDAALEIAARAQSEMQIAEGVLSGGKKTIRSMSREEYNEYKREKKKARKMMLPEVEWLQDLQKKEREYAEQQCRLRRKQDKIGRARWVRRELNRRKLLPTDHVCKYCNEHKPKSRQWVVCGEFVGCVTCYRKVVKK